MPARKRSGHKVPDARVEAGVNWHQATATLKEKEVETPGLIDGFLKRVDDQIYKKQLSM